MTSASPWWTPHVYADRKPFLKARGRIAAAIRHFFAAERLHRGRNRRACRSRPGNEAHISAFGIDLIGPGGEKSRLYLHTSPEFACKKLLAAGEERIFTFARVFRNRERRALHHPEFTMLEWYRANEPLSRLMEDCAGLLARRRRSRRGRTVSSGADSTADPFEEPEVVTVCEAFDRYANIDLLALLGRPRRPRGRGGAGWHRG